MFCFIIFHFNTGFLQPLLLVVSFPYKLVLEIEMDIENGMMLMNIFHYSPHPKFLILFHCSSYYYKLIADY